MSEWLEVYHILELRLRAQGTPPSNKCLSCEKCAKCAYGRARGPSSCPPPSPHSLIPSHTHTHKQPACVTHTHACQVCVSWLKAFGLKYGSPKRGQRLGGCDAVRRALGSSAPQAARAGAECEHCAWAPQLHGMGHEAPQSQSSHCVPAEFAHAGARGPVQAA
jgi:hypothetical protein